METTSANSELGVVQDQQHAHSVHTEATRPPARSSSAGVTCLQDGVDTPRALASLSEGALPLPSLPRQLLSFDSRLRARPHCYRESSATRGWCAHSLSLSPPTQVAQLRRPRSRKISICTQIRVWRAPAAQSPALVLRSCILGQPRAPCAAALLHHVSLVRFYLMPYQLLSVSNHSSRTPCFNFTLRVRVPCFRYTLRARLVCNSRSVRAGLCVLRQTLARRVCYWRYTQSLHQHR